MPFDNWNISLDGFSVLFAIFIGYSFSFRHIPSFDLVNY